VSRRVRLTCWLSALLLAGIQAWGQAHATNPDGLSYLDLADAFLAGDFGAAISPIWGPLYPGLLAVGLRLAHPAPEWVLPLVHAVNYVIFLGALVSFDWFLQELLRARKRESAQGIPVLTDTGLGIFAYAVFIYSALGLIGLGLITPDLCVAVACFAAAGLVLRMCRTGPHWITVLMLGVVLGLAYLAKSVMFPLGIAVLVSLPFVPGHRGTALRTVALAAGTFFALASLLIVPISRETGRLSFGTAGKLAYAFVVNRVPYTNWQGDSAFPGSLPLHPPRRLSDDPEVFEYSAHLKGTYPPWFDPTWWTAGLRAEFHPWNQTLRLLRSATFYIDLFMGTAGVSATLLVAVLLLGADARVVMLELRHFLPVIILCLAGLAIYAPVLVDTRFIGSFAAMFWILPAAAARGGRPRVPGWWTERAAFVCAACLGISIGIQSGTEAWKVHDQPDPQPRIARLLGKLGLHHGDRVISVGIKGGSITGSSFDAFWAYLAGVQIVAEVPEGRDFLCAPRPTAERWYRTFARLGARAVVSGAMPRWCAADWLHVEGTDYYVRPLEADVK
jgi:hypothetical protein